MALDCILLLVFHYISLQDLCRARAVCKKWNSVILDENLTSADCLHLQNKSDGREEVWCPKTSECQKLQLRDEYGETLFPLVSSHGLVLCVHKDRPGPALVVGNPLLCKWKELPPLPIKDLVIPVPAGWMNEILLVVDTSFSSIASGTRYKIILLPSYGWHTRKSFHSNPNRENQLKDVLHYDSEDGVWIVHSAMKLKQFNAMTKQKEMCKFTSLVTMGAWIRVFMFLFCIDTFSWEEWVPVEPFPPGTKNWFTARRKLSWHHFNLHLYNGTKMIGVGTIKDCTRVISLAVMELDRITMAWTLLNSITFEELYGDPKFHVRFNIYNCSLPGYWTRLQNRTIFWACEGFPPVAYDLVESKWKLIEKLSWDDANKRYCFTPYNKYQKVVTLNNFVLP